MKSGTNLLAVVAENKPTTLPANPAGLLACIELRFTGGETLRVSTDGAWRCATNEVAHWDEPAFDDRAWRAALMIGRYGDGPWGRVGRPGDAALAPQATGIPGLVRIIYVPERHSIEVHDLGAGARYSVAYFDPVTGEKRSLGYVSADNQGTWHCSPPSRQSHDWVLVLENR